MLVLSRQKDESIMIGDNVEITIVDVRGDKVRLGITAPRSIPVHRREVYEAIQREKNSTAEQPPENAEAQPQEHPEAQFQEHAEAQPQTQPDEQPHERPRAQAK